MQKILGFISLLGNHAFESIRFIKYSNLFSLNTPEKLRGKIGFRYHSIEKGLINSSIRFRFGKEKLAKLLIYINIWISKDYSLNDSQFLSACSVVDSYIKLHELNNYDISDIVSVKDQEMIKKYSNKVPGGVVSYSISDYFKYTNSPFDKFSDSRHSVRHFNGIIVPDETIIEVIQLARNAPSVCNRQGFKVKLINNPALLSEILHIQDGLNATAETVKQCLIVSVDRAVFVSSAEWYQVFIDGGIFLQNLLYSLHFYQIAAVSLNWSKHYLLDKKIEKLINFPKSEKIVAMVAIGYPQEDIKVPQSLRKSVNEILDIIS